MANSFVQSAYELICRLPPTPTHSFFGELNKAVKDNIQNHASYYAPNKIAEDHHGGLPKAALPFNDSVSFVVFVFFTSTNGKSCMYVQILIKKPK